MNIKDDFIDELLKYDYVSKKKGRGISSILMNKVGKGRVYKMSEKTREDTVMEHLSNNNGVIDANFVH